MENEPQFKTKQYNNNWSVMIKVNLSDMFNKHREYYTKSLKILSKMIGENQYEIINIVQSKYNGLVKTRINSITDNRTNEIEFTNMEDAEKFITEYIEPRYIMEQIKWKRNQ
jgi:hypothetical protein